MTVTFDISGDAEKRLRERAATTGKDASRYAAEIVERALTDKTTRYPEPSEEERARLRAAARKLIQMVREIALTLTGPVITDFDEAFEEIMREKVERQGMKF